MMRKILFMLSLMYLTFTMGNPAYGATETGASVGYCEGCDNGVVELTMDGGTATVIGLTFDADAGHWAGIGKVSYVGQGLSINDAAASFQVTLVDSPTGVPGSPLFNPNCSRATRIASSIRVLGSNGPGSSYLLTTSNFQIATGTPCASATMDVSIDPSPRAIGKVKKTFQANRALGRVLKI